MMIMIYNQKPKNIHKRKTASAQSFIIILLESIFGVWRDEERQQKIVQIFDDQHKRKIARHHHFRIFIVLMRSLSNKIRI